MTRAVLLDLHGTLGDQGAYGIRDFTAYSFAEEAVRLFADAGLLAIVVTNQSRIARGQLTATEFESFMHELCRELRARGAVLSAVYYCPHAEADGCDCRKPRTGLLQRASDDFGLALDQCYLVGDVGAWDMVAAKRVGCRAVLVRTGWGEGSLGPYRHLWSEVEADHIAADLLDAARWIVLDHETANRAQLTQSPQEAGPIIRPGVE